MTTQHDLNQDKPTTTSIGRATMAADAIANRMLTAARCGVAANHLFKVGAVNECREQLLVMRAELAALRRTQTAAIAHIDAALRTAR